MTRYVRHYQAGDRVRVTKENRSSTIPDGDRFRNHETPIGAVIELFKYDNEDNTWKGTLSNGDITDWIHEDCLESVDAVTDDEEAAAIASIQGAVVRKYPHLVSADCECDIDYLDPKCTNPEHVTPPAQWADLVEQVRSQNEELERLYQLLDDNNIDY